MKTSASRGDVSARKGDIRELALNGIGPRVLVRQLERMNRAVTSTLAGKTQDAARALAGASRPEDTAQDLVAAAHYAECLLGRPEVDESTKLWWHQRVRSAYRDLFGYTDDGIGACRLLADVLDSIPAGTERAEVNVRLYFMSFFPEQAARLATHERETASVQPRSSRGARTITLKDEFRALAQAWHRRPGRARGKSDGGKWQLLQELVSKTGLKVAGDPLSIKRACERQAAKRRAPSQKK